MFNQKHSGVSVKFICLILISPLILMAQNDGDFDPNDGVDFEVSKTYTGDVLDIKIADVDGDHIADVIYGGLSNTNLHIMYGKKHGGFDAPQSYGADANTIAFGYFNDDKYLDIACRYFKDLSICLNNGDRTFSIETLEQESANLGGVATGYFNDDSHMDIISAYSNIYYGDGDGNFPVILTLPYNFQSVFVSDFNNDEIDDFIGIDRVGNAGIYLNDNSGNFSKSSEIDLGDLTLGVSIDDPFADFNRDGNADFAFITPIGSQPLYSNITVGYGDGAGGIMDVTELSVPKTAYCLSISDVNRDNYLDLIAANASDAIMEVFHGGSGGVFSDAYQIDMQTDSVTHALATGDLNRDGNPDFVSGAFWGDSISIIINQGEEALILTDPMITTGYSNVSIDIINPLGFELSQNYKTVAGANYWRQDVDLDNSIDERAIDYNLQYGEYKIIVKPKLNALPGAQFSTTINIGPDEMILFKDYEVPTNSKGAGDSLVFYYTVEEFSSIQPANGSSVETDKPLFDWSGMVEHIPGVTSYHFEVSPYYEFDSPLVQGVDIDSPQYIPDSPLTGNDVYYWRFMTFDGTEWSEYSRTFAVVCKASTDIDDPIKQLPEDLILSQNYPNPFNPITEICFSLPKSSHAKLEIYNIIGKKVTTLVDEVMGSGEHRVIWDGRDNGGTEAASGLYFYRLSTENCSVSKKMLMLK